MTAEVRPAMRPDGEASFCGMIGRHPLMLALFDEVHAAASLDAPVLIEGETGTGKELVAQALHELSARRGRLVAVNAAELAEPLAEAELFGAVRGAYTGAVTSRPGLIRSADGGTLFLDEACDLPLSLQAKLLRVLEGGRVRQVGSEVDRPVRFRLVMSVQRPVWELVATGRWRQDFFYRVAGIVLRTPRLSDRKSDIPALASHLLAGLGAGELPEELADRLAAHRWSGNVRELKRVLERIIHRAWGRPIAAKDVDQALQEERSNAPHVDRRAVSRTLRDVERHHIELTLDEVGGDWQAAALVLGLSRSAFYRRLEELDIARPTRRPFPTSGTHSHARGTGAPSGAEAARVSRPERTG